MEIPTPDTVTITRATQTGNVYGGMTTVGAAIPCMIVPAGEDTGYTIGRRINEGDIILICEPSYDVKAGDLVVDDSTADEYRVKEAQGKQRNPITWTAHHQEVVMIPNVK